MTAIKTFDAYIGNIGYFLLIVRSSNETITKGCDLTSTGVAITQAVNDQFWVQKSKNIRKTMCNTRFTTSTYAAPQVRTEFAIDIKMILHAFS